MSYQKVGGLHFFKIGRVRLSLCIARRKVEKPTPTWHLHPFYLENAR